jgi:hypothetical protein
MYMSLLILFFGTFYSEGVFTKFSCLDVPFGGFEG